MRPPTTQCLGGELGRVVIDPHADPTFVVRLVIDPIGGDLAQGLILEVLAADLLRRPLGLPLSAGLSISQQIENGFLTGLHKYGPAITVAGKYLGNYAAGPEQSGITSLLAAHPNVSGIMTQGYCTPVFNALKAAGKAAVPAVCYGYNGEMEACGTGGHECAILTNTPGEVQLAMQIALKILQGGKPPAHGNTIIPYPMYLYVSPTPKVTLSTPVPVQVLKENVNFFPKLAAGLSLPYALPQYIKYITPQQAAG